MHALLSGPQSEISAGLQPETVARALGYLRDRISVPRDTRNAVEGSYDGSYESYSYSYSAAAAPAGAPAFGSYETAPAAAPRPTSDAEYEYSEYTYSPPSDMPPAAR